jgi:hypothetical protein
MGIARSFVISASDEYCKALVLQPGKIKKTSIIIAGFILVIFWFQDEELSGKDKFNNSISSISRLEEH